jgi:chromosome segregation protein
MLEKVQADALNASQTVAWAALEIESFVASLQHLAAETEAVRSQRGLLQQQVRRQRHELSRLQSQQQQMELAAGELRLQRETLCERLRDDYAIDLAQAAAGESVDSEAPEPPGRQQIEHEIDQLRTQLNTLGTVNIESLEELDALEERFKAVSEQYRDLVNAKSALERIIQRINIDSRQLFLGTLDVVKGHFRDLFRRLFGGGDADIELEEDGGDVLEGGIEIVARPPGKETRTISLLSGGERTLTCVALLLAVFRSKPSPFCVLDEVDAALDESNIGRFVTVLQQFLSTTQFLVVTHSKLTMAGADTIYGITMQESGVSKQVSVRFEDLSEEGASNDGPAIHQVAA